MQKLYNIHLFIVFANTLLYCLSYRNTCMLVMINFNTKYINARKNTDLTSARVKHNNRDEWFYPTITFYITLYLLTLIIQWKKKLYTWNNHALMSIFCIYYFFFMYSFLLKSVIVFIRSSLIKMTFFVLKILFSCPKMAWM